MNKSLKILLVYILVLAGCQNYRPFECQSGLFLEDIVSTEMYEFGGSIHPEGNMFVFALSSPNYYIYEYTILVTRFEEGLWMTPEVASFSGSFSDRDPFFSPDGEYLYFSSKRPIDKFQAKNDFDLWRVKIDKGEFSFDPEHLGKFVNTDRHELGPSVDKNLNLYFAGYFPDKNYGSIDIYKSKYENGEYLDVENVGEPINSKWSDGYPSIDANGDQMFFASRNPETSFGDYDIYHAKQNHDRTWITAHMDSTINTEYAEISPYAFSNRLFYSSEKRTNHNRLSSSQDWDALQRSILNGKSNIYITDISKIE